MVLAELSIFPLDKGDSMSSYVSRVVHMLKQAGITMEVHSMGTVIEGSWEEVKSAIDGAFLELERDCDRIYMTVKIDYRKGRENAIKGKIRSVEEKL
jgi:uncharacterized protein (TIGR00106 family)